MPSAFREVSRDAQQALTEFSLAFDEAMALGEVEQWAQSLGLFHPSKAIKTIFPLSLSAAGYVKRDGDDRLRELYERSLSVTTEDWMDGVTAKARVIEAPDFTGWGKEPARIAREAQRLINIMVADLLASNPLLDFYRYEMPGGSVASTVHLFDNAHPVNVFESAYGTFDNNLASSGASIPTVVRLMRAHFRSINGPNGRPLGLRLSHFIVPAAREEEALDFFERDVLVEAVTNVAGTENVGGVTRSNRLKKGVTLVVADELTGTLPSGATGSANMYFGIANGGDRPAWVIQDTGDPEEIVQDKSSDYYAATSKVSLRYIKSVGVAGALGQGIVRCDVS